MDTVHLRAVLPLEAKEGEDFLRTEPAEDADERLGQVVPDRRLLLGVPAFAEAGGDPLPGVAIDAGIGPGPIDESAELRNRQPVELLDQDGSQLLTDLPGGVGPLETP